MTNIGEKKDYEKYRDAIEKRVSNRRFTGASIPEDKIVKLKELIDSYNKESGLNMQVITGDNGPFEGGDAYAHATTDHERVMVDLGIAKLHFDVGAGSGKWNLI